MRRTLRSLTLAVTLASSALTSAVRGQEPKPGPAPEQPPSDVPAEDVPAEEIPAEEMPVEDTGEPAPNRPAPKGKGVVWGVVLDAVTNEPLLDAQVTVVGTKHKVIADVDGRYRLELPPGSYEIRVWYELYKARRVQNVRVAAGQLQKIDVSLDLDKTAEEVMEVEAAPERASAAAQLMIRKNASYSADAVGAQDIAKTPDKNAAEAAKRVVGATVIGGRYVYVRGLGERYSNSLLNGTPLPSPEPDRQAVPLDLFPSVILSDLTIAKTFTPDMPGDFAGGSVRVNTRDLPEEFLLQGTLSAGFNTQSVFQDRLSYQGSGMDWLGIDSGVRALPAEIPDYKIGRLLKKPDGTTITSEELTGYGQLLNAYMTTRPATNLPNLSGSVVTGDSHKIGSGVLGYTAALTYGRRFSTREGEIIKTFDPPAGGSSDLTLRNDYLADTGLDQVGWGGLLTVTYKPQKNHQITLTGLHSRSSDNEARFISGFNNERGTELTDTRLRFVTRSLSFGQVAVEHVLPSLDRAVLGYNFGLSLATSDEPDTRQTVYTLDGPSGTLSYEEDLRSGSHFFAEQEETQYGGGIDWTQPVIQGDLPTKLKFGALFSRRSRTFDSRRFVFKKIEGADTQAVFRLPPDELFTPENIGTNLRLHEETRGSDAYTAEQNVYAGYVMADASLSSWLRVVLGGRVEANEQALDSRDPNKDEPVRGEINVAELLPALALIFRTTRTSNLRLSVSRTVARPQLRELAPTIFSDYYGARDVTGNTDLRQTSIYNGDLRFEIFPGASEVAALTVFYKEFVDPIEQAIIGGSNVIKWQNAKAARVAGVELEARKGLGFVAPALSDLGILANFTLASSRVELDPTIDGLNTVQTNNVRPLAGQSPFVLNLGLDYVREATGTRARLVYNVAGRRIAQVGTDKLPDVYEQPRHQLDLTVGQRIGEHVDLKATAENLVDSPVVFTQGKTIEDDDANTTNRYTLGRTFGLAVTVSY
jgi:hypothetical protein